MSYSASQSYPACSLLRDESFRSTVNESAIQIIRPLRTLGLQKLRICNTEKWLANHLLGRKLELGNMSYVLF